MKASAALNLFPFLLSPPPSLFGGQARRGARPRGFVTAARRARALFADNGQTTDRRMDGWMMGRPKTEGDKSLYKRLHTVLGPVAKNARPRRLAVSRRLDVCNRVQTSRGTHCQRDRRIVEEALFGFPQPPTILRSAIQLLGSASGKHLGTPARLLPSSCACPSHSSRRPLDTLTPPPPRRHIAACNSLVLPRLGPPGNARGVKSEKCLDQFGR